MILPCLTSEHGAVPNEPNELCAELGRELVRLCLSNEQPTEMCGDCAFRLGSVPNRSATAHDALAALVNGDNFICHHGENRPCAGFQRARERSKSIATG
jgi:hypothetical protein